MISLPKPSRLLKRDPLRALSQFELSIGKGAGSQVAAKFPSGVILKSGAFCRAEGPVFVFNFSIETAGPSRRSG